MRKKLVVGAGLVGIVVVAIALWPQGARSPERLRAAFRLGPPDGGFGVLLEPPARSSDAAMSAGDARTICMDAPGSCVLAPGGASRLVLASRAGRTDWAFVGETEGVQYVTVFDSRMRRVEIAVLAPKRWSVGRPPFGPGVVEQTPYLFNLMAHCGIKYTSFDGRGWITDSPLDDGQGNPPPGWYDDDAVPTMTLISGDIAEFRWGERTLRFRPFDPTRDAPAGSCA